MPHFSKIPRFGSFSFFLPTAILSFPLLTCKSITFSEPKIRIPYNLWCPIQMTENSIWVEWKRGNLLVSKIKSLCINLQDLMTPIISAVLSLILHFSSLLFSEWAPFSGRLSPYSKNDCQRPGLPSITRVALNMCSPGQGHTGKFTHLNTEYFKVMTKPTNYPLPWKI